MTSECPERKPEHCPDCHVYIRHCADHTGVCGKKTWYFDKFANLYVKAPKERFILSSNAPIRFLKDGCWRKAADGIDLISPESGAIFRFKSEMDVSFYASAFVPVRIGIVIKEKLVDKFVQKLLLFTSKTKILVAAPVENGFDRTSEKNNRISTLILALSAEDNPELVVNEFPKGKPARKYFLRYDQMWKKFDIPYGIKIGSASKGIDEYGNDAQMHRQLGESNVEAPNLQLAIIQNFESRISNVASQNSVNNDVNCDVCFGAHHWTKCQRADLSNCFECHVPARLVADHALMCSVKNWYASVPVEKYVKIPSERCILSFQMPIHILLDGNVCKPSAGMVLFSSMADTYFKFETAKKIALLSTGYTRIRLPIVVEENPIQLTERLVLMTSHDRAIIAAKSSRQINEHSIGSEYEHNTPLVLYMLEKPGNIMVTVHGAGGMVQYHEIE